MSSPVPVFSLRGPFLRAVAAMLVASIVVNLFYHGAQSYAVGAVPPPYDKLAHAILYGGLATLLWVALGGRRAWLAFAACATIAAADEIVQLWEPGRSADVLDFLAGVAGAAVALAVAHTFARKTLSRR